jgi:hypothetical protein
MSSPAMPAARTVLRAVWLGLGVAALVLAISLVVRDGLGPIPVVLFMIAPDLAFLAAAGASHDHGQLPARAVPLYNALHGTIGPVILILLGVMGLLSTWWLAAGLSWAAHVTLDRGFGYGLRTRDGWQRG